MRKIKVHIADDHQLLIDGINAVLSSENNIEVVGSSLNGEDVLNWFALNEADILILDINMPKVDGIAVLQSFVKSGFQQKVIVLSSYDDAKLIKEVLKIGANGFLAKKCAGENIVEAINAVYCGKQYFSESVKDKLLSSFTKNNLSIDKISQDGTFFSPLTPRETDVLKLICKQYNSNEISKTLHISINTVETHRKNLIHKLKVKNVVGLAIYAIKNNIV
ncbi:DNA-binding NarL/FixJ family response regulator [Lutibacter oceani]|uniref:DNA-binding NarL/FixJ family response regulator n=1 Tax=Lutibacter oceani TaxID=1853311 RepID=A0A3D9RV41_9FLAO|nr:response regulator transcription factor [Lutibacter oceani]REE80535.1 DNA-binding NarL/FixJ family response regulator [Lutibacter oceani]